MTKQEQALILSSILKEHGKKFFDDKVVLIVGIINEAGDALVNTNIGPDVVRQYIAYLHQCFESETSRVYDTKKQKIEDIINVPGPKEIN